MPQSTLDLILRTKKEGAGEKDAQKGLSDLMSTATKTVGVLTGAAVLMKKAFEFGEAGATILQTRDSFDLLLEKVGAAPDLLDQLQVASRGTVDDLTLMSATIGLVAGAQGELATAMAGSAPELLEIAKAAQKLKPELGDVAFIYESLATGVKRASPLMIDNAGITLKIGEANEKMAALLGKSVEQLTAEEQKMALLTATLEGGRVLIDQVGGSTESATDSFARLESNTKNLSDALEAKLAPSLATAAEAASVLMTWSEEVAKATETGNKVILESTDSYDEYAKAVMNARVAAGRMHVAQREYGLDMLAEGKNLDYLIPAWDYYTEAQWNNLKSTVGLIDETDRLKASQERLATEVKITNGNYYDATAAMQAAIGTGISWSETIDNMAEAAEDARPSLADLFATINTSIASPIEAFINDIKFMQAGGADIYTAFEGIKKAFLDEKITADEAIAYSEEIYIETKDALVNAGIDSKDEAAAAINEAFGIPLEEAMGKLDGINNAVFLLTSMRHKIWLDFDYNLPDFSAMGGGGGGGAGAGGGNKSNYAAGGAFWVDEPTRITVGEGGEDEFVTVTPRSKMGPEQMNQTNINLYATYPPTTPASIDQDIRTLMFYYQTRSH